MRSRQSGFTLIELVTVIIILGVVAAIAIPRFAKIATTSKISDVNNMLGAVRSANLLAYSQALVNNQTGATGTVTMEGVAVGLLYGYPDSKAGIGHALSSTSGFTYVPGATTTSTALFTLNSAVTPSSCYVSFRNPGTANTAPTIGTLTTGC